MADTILTAAEHAALIATEIFADGRTPNEERIEQYIKDTFVESEAFKEQANRSEYEKGTHKFMRDWIKKCDYLGAARAIHKLSALYRDENPYKLATIRASMQKECAPNQDVVMTTHMPNDNVVVMTKNAHVAALNYGQYQVGIAHVTFKTGTAFTVEWLQVMDFANLSLAQAAYSDQVETILHAMNYGGWKPCSTDKCPPAHLYATESKRGLYQKYDISKSDGSPVNPKADYFVLRLDDHQGSEVHRSACVDAVLKYAIQIQPFMPLLAKDLFDKYSPFNYKK